MQDWAAMKIDIDLRFLSQMRAHARMLQFRIGDRVSFHAFRPASCVGADGSVASENQGPNVIL